MLLMVDLGKGEVAVEKYTFWLITSAIGILVFSVMAKMIWSYMEGKGVTPRAANGFITAHDMQTWCKMQHIVAREVLDARMETLETRINSNVEDVRKDIKALHQRLDNGNGTLANIAAQINNITKRINE